MKPGATKADEKLDRLKQENIWMRGEVVNTFLPTDAELAGLGQARATAVRDALLAKGDIDAARVFLAAAASGSLTDGHVRLELKLR
jgi:hypothetical protein